MGRIILLTFVGLVIWLIRRDSAQREGVSSAVWIPTIWVGILASRPLSSWVGFGGGDDSLEGSPLDRLFFFVIIIAAIAVVSRRRINWNLLIKTNWPIFAFYAYFLVSVLWSDSPLASFKRWFKDFGNIFVALIILTEASPTQAFRAVFVRCGYVLIPLSVIFLRYFPDLGRTYNIYTGEMEATGVTFQKNSLGAMVLICGLVLIWDWVERSQSIRSVFSRLDRWLPIGILVMGLYLLKVCDSKTSIACLFMGGGILLSVRLPLLRKKMGALGNYALIGMVSFVLLDSLFGIREGVLTFMGRDATLTGRTDVWKFLLSLDTDPIFGIGFCSFWSDQYYLNKLTQGIGKSAHNGYLEMYLDGGAIGVFFLILLLGVVAVRINRQLRLGGNYSLLRFAVFLVTIIGNISESHYGRLTPLWFMFIAVALTPLHDEEITPVWDESLEGDFTSDDESMGESSLSHS